jgi:hypothetical protein
MAAHEECHQTILFECHCFGLFRRLILFECHCFGVVFTFYSNATVSDCFGDSFYSNATVSELDWQPKSNLDPNREVQEEPCNDTVAHEWLPMRNFMRNITKPRAKNKGANLLATTRFTFRRGQRRSLRVLHCPSARRKSTGNRCVSEISDFFRVPLPTCQEASASTFLV